ncbi:MAG: DUF1249 domain-containing protein [Pseudomonadota bacterium]
MTKTSVIPLPKPNTFAGLMELYESNYIKIRKLCNSFNVIDDYSISRIQNGLDLHMLVIERTKYTITVNLSYRFIENQKISDLEHYPNILVKIYFDAMQAEVLRRVSKPRSHQGSPIKSNGLCNKWADNRFLFKWLSFCLHQGHQFGANNKR